MTVHMEEVTTRRQLREFLDLPARLHTAAGTTDRSVPLLRSEIRSWFTEKHWFPGITLWLARTDSGIAVGRMITHHSDAFDAELGQRTGLFGALEGVNEETIRTLVRSAADRHRARGATRLFGPVTPLPNVTGGILRAGFDHPGFLDTVWTPPFYATALAEVGLEPWGIADTWEVDIAGIPADARRAPAQREWRERGLTLRHPRRFRSTLAEDLRPALNASFAQLTYFTPIGPAQMAAQLDGLGVIMDPELIILAEDGAEVAGFIVAVPDPVDILRAHDGRLNLCAGLDLLRWRRRGRDVVLIVQGTRPDHQGRGILGLMIRQLYARLHAGGYRRLRVTFIGRDNPGSARVFEKIGGRPLHELSFYQQEL